MPTPETVSQFGVARRLVAWNYDPADSVVAATGVRLGPQPFGNSSLNSDRIAVQPGSQALIEIFCRWGTGARPGGGLVKLILRPRYLHYYNTTPAVPSGATADRDNPVPVLWPDRNQRAALGNAIGVPEDANQPIRPMKYQHNTVAAAGVGQRIVRTQLVDDEIELFRDADPGAAYRQSHAFFYPENGQEPQTIGITGSTVAGQTQAPRERPFFVTIDWEGTGPNDPANPPFIANDAITILVRTGSNAVGQ